ncbi:hypothetical protein [Streptomyces sp. NPDC005141]
MPAVVPDALELLKARINFDLTGKNAEKRMVYAAVGLSVGCVVLGVRAGGDSSAYTVAGILWAVLMVALGVGLVVTRKRNAKFAALLRAAGFAPVTEEGGRVRYLPPTAGYGPARTAAGPYGPYTPCAPQGPYTSQPGSAPYAPQGPYAGQPGGPYVGPAQAQVHPSAQAPAQPQNQPPVPAPGPYAPPAPGPYGQQVSHSVQPGAVT